MSQFDQHSTILIAKVFVLVGGNKTAQQVLPTKGSYVYNFKSSIWPVVRPKQYELQQQDVVIVSIYSTDADDEILLCTDSVTIKDLDPMPPSSTGESSTGESSTGGPTTIRQLQSANKFFMLKHSCIAGCPANISEIVLCLDECPEVVAQDKKQKRAAFESALASAEREVCRLRQILSQM